MSEEDHRKTRLLASYVPKLLLKSFQQGTQLKLPHIDIIQGAVVFADISGMMHYTDTSQSGFTPLTEKMSREGREGIEQMSRYLNSFFDKLIGMYVTSLSK
jgi:hypothetical protein